MLYYDDVVYQQQTYYQNLVFTSHELPSGQYSVVDFYINGSLQFSSMDEHVYHEMLVHPAMLTASRQNNILVVGGGDGLAVRELLKWQPQSVTVVDYDTQLTDLFSRPEKFMDDKLAVRLNKMTGGALLDSACPKTLKP